MAKKIIPHFTNSITGGCLRKNNYEDQLRKDIEILVQRALVASVIHKWGPVEKMLKLIENDKKDFSFHIGIGIISMREMSSLNSRYRNCKPKPTDILSFPSQFDEDYCQKYNRRESPALENILLGDIFLCPEWIHRKYRTLMIPLYTSQRLIEMSSGRRLILKLLVHGIVHLLGLDHHRSYKETVLMRKIEMSTLGHFLRLNAKSCNSNLKNTLNYWGKVLEIK